MPWPRDDGYPLYRELNDYGPAELLKIGPANTYPWPLVTKNGKPMTVSAEMAVVYRFHEFIISKFPIMDAAGETLWEQDLFGTGFNSTGFVDAGLENVLRGMAAVTIPNFKSGVDENFRSAGRYRGHPFDLVTWSIIHEREQGLPTFNQYFREYNKQDPEHPVPIRDEWHKFSTDPEMVANLKRLYKSPDDVDLVVGVQLDENLFPGTTIPQTALIISLISLFGMGNSDRFSIGFAMMRCLLVDKPWDCHPSNALEDLLWEPRNVPGFPDYRWYSSFWMKEFDIQNHGAGLLWRLITENSEIKCLQTAPLFPADEEKNPIICHQPKTPANIPSIILFALQVLVTLFRQHLPEIAGGLTALIAVISLYHHKKESHYPPVLKGLPVVGEALSFRKKPLRVLQTGINAFGSSAFGIEIRRRTHYVIMHQKDLEMMQQDNRYGVKFSLRKFNESRGLPSIIGKKNFESDLHTKLVRTHLADPDSLERFGKVIEGASAGFVRCHPLVVTGKSTHHVMLDDWINEYVTFVVSRCMVGPEGFDDEDLLVAFQQLGDHVDAAMRLSSVLPSFLHWVAAFQVKRDVRIIRRVVLPIIERRRGMTEKGDGAVMMDSILEAVSDDRRAAGMVPSSLVP
jgi:peroxidase